MNKVYAKWTNAEGIISHSDGYVSEATIWFDSNDEVVAIEPHSVCHYVTKEVHYYNRIMGEELMEYGVELYEDDELENLRLSIIYGIFNEDTPEVVDLEN